MGRRVDPPPTPARDGRRMVRAELMGGHTHATLCGVNVHVYRRGGLYLMGLLMALAAYIPFVGFFVPAYFALAFIDYLLAALDQRRLSAPSQ